MSRGVSWSPIIPVLYSPCISCKSHLVLLCGYSNQILNCLEHFPFASMNLELQHKMVVNVSIPLSDWSLFFICSYHVCICETLGIGNFHAVFSRRLFVIVAVVNLSFDVLALSLVLPTLLLIVELETTNLDN
ncbi:hypothetical protein T05_13553 [Trichinella murrelli]|uniref:Uncharacterized protein n=1 Tax=Trichinella murrelli TaxID=144512 RepID=A0A0V0TPV7_9BILA|nr:hypothetical protein T05_13553 [Trichinella murrelli]